MKHCFLLFSLVLNLAVSGQYYAVGTQTVSYIDSARTNRTISADVHYPALTSGANMPFANDSFPVIIFGHGFQMTASAYIPFADTLASHGYIVVFPNTESSFSPNHSSFALDLIFLYNTLIAANVSPASLFYHKVIPRGAIGGHSMGGGCAVLSAHYSNPATCYFTFAEATTTPSSISAASSMTKPYLCFSGSYDCIAPYATNQLPTYDSSGAPCKYLIEITGASHCQFGAGNLACNFGETVSGCGSPPLTRTAQINTTMAYLLPYLDDHLKNSALAQSTFDSVYNADAVNIKTKSCHMATDGLDRLLPPSLTIYPTPAYDWLNIISAQKISEAKVWDMMGRLQMIGQPDSDRAALHISEFAPGGYLLQIITDGIVYYRLFTKR